MLGRDWLGLGVDFVLTKMFEQFNKLLDFGLLAVVFYGDCIVDFVGFAA